MNTFGYSACLDPLIHVLGLSTAVDAVVWWLYHQASSGVQAYVFDKALRFFTVEQDFGAASLSFAFFT